MRHIIASYPLFKAPLSILPWIVLPNVIEVGPLIGFPRVTVAQPGTSARG